jgi:mono/diheme cytochrome c family protein
MPSYRDALEEGDLWALAAYVASLVPPKAKPFVSEDEKIGREVESKYQPGRKH